MIGLAIARTLIAIEHGKLSLSRHTDVKGRCNISVFGGFLLMGPENVFAHDFGF